MTTARPDPFIAQMERAVSDARQREHKSRLRGTFLSLAGISLDEDRVELLSYLWLERLESPPRVMGSEATRLALPTHQLVLLHNQDDPFARWVVDGVFWTFVATLRITTPHDFIACQLADRSWDAVDGFGVDEVQVRDPTPYGGRYWRRSGITHIASSDAMWAAQRMKVALAMRAESKFGLALAAFETSFGEEDLRMAAAKVWQGIESLFEFSGELSFRIAASAASVLHPVGERRLRSFKDIHKLYGVRSKIIHGAEVPPGDIAAHVSEARSVLAALLRDAVDLGRVRTRAEIEASMFTGSGALDLK